MKRARRNDEMFGEREKKKEMVESVLAIARDISTTVELQVGKRRIEFLVCRHRHARSTSLKITRGTFFKGDSKGHG